MKSRKMRLICVLAVLFLFGMVVPGCQSEPLAVKAPAAGAQQKCPVCPTCPGEAPKTDSGVALKASDGPETSVLYHLTDIYAPVKFTHKAHTGYAENCKVCHHHHSEIERTPACRECHGLPFKTLAKPGLKGAYHRQCMNCHRDSGSGPLGCDDCHEKRKAIDKPPKVPGLEGIADTITLGHVAKEYGPVKFNHMIHVDMADTCKDCHHHQGEVEKTPPCRECHNTRATVAGEKKLGIMDAYHKQCLDCHRGMGGPQKCEGCHGEKKAR